MTRREIFCCGCQKTVQARLTTGEEVYPGRPDLSSLPFWRCDACGNHVGTHHKTRNPTRPLGCIPTPELRRARQHIHRVLDGLWKSGKMSRTEVYRVLSNRLGWKYHTAKLRDLEEARKVYRLLLELRGALD